MSEPSALRRGDSGEAVRDLQQRLGALGHPVADDHGVFDGATEVAVRSFQEHRGLPVDGVVGPHTWASLVESGFSLGDRLLYVRRPMLRGDDVAELQRRLDALGFDAGRVDGIFGPDTAGALTGFQRSSGLIGDGICGPSTIAALDRVGTLAAGSVAGARQREALRSGPVGLDGRRIHVSTTPGLAVLGEAVVRGLTLARAHTVLDVSGDDDSAIADGANAAGADLCLALRLGPEPGLRTAYFETTGFRSEAGLLAAGRLAEHLDAVFGPEFAVVGRAYPLLRETRMAAVVVELGPAGDPGALARVISRSGDVARAVVRALRVAFDSPGAEIPAPES